MTNSITVNSIFSEYADDYISKSGNFISFEQLRVINSITACRSGRLGYRIEKCDCCGNEIILFNSCRNRHCPQCQNIKREKWLLARKSELLPCKYFHVIFTLPHSLNDLLYCNQAELYSLFFKAAADTLKEFAHNSRSLGAAIGFLMVLHTWGQQLSYHPHLHCLVTDGGLSNDKLNWISSKKENFLFDVKKLSAAFSEKFSNALLNCFKNKKLKPLFFNDNVKCFEPPNEFENFVNNLKHQKWVVYCRAPVDANDDYSIIDYLGKYVYRVAIANSRLISFENFFVKFKYKDYRDNTDKTMELPLFEFIRRFLLHVLPSGFQKIRYYGLLANNQKQKMLKTCRELLSKEYDAVQSAFDHINAQDNPLESAFSFFKENFESLKCTACKKGILVTFAIFLPAAFGYRIIIPEKSRSQNLKSGP